MDYAATRKSLLDDAVALRTQARAHRQTVDQSIIDITAMTATSRVTIERAWEALDRLNRSLRAYQTPPSARSR